MKKSILPNPISQSSLMLWWIHRLAEEFENQAILKGGMSLALFDSPRQTNDLDYVIIPYQSKKQIEPLIKKISQEASEAKIDIQMHSKQLRLLMFYKSVSVQLEFSVAKQCKSQVTSTVSLAQKNNAQAKLIRIMSLDVALSHKLAAWNERRLYRDLYDCYFLYYVQQQKPDIKTLKDRLNQIESRLPKLKQLKSMSIPEFLDVLEQNIQSIDVKKLQLELVNQLDQVQLFDLDKRLKTALFDLIVFMRSQI